MSIKVLFIYGSSEGHTSKISHYLDQQARNLGFETQIKNIGTLHELATLQHLLQQAECIIIGASVHLGQHQSKIKQLLKTHHAIIKSKPSVFFSVSLMAASSREEDRALARQQALQFVEKQDWKPEQVWTVPGALQYTRYNLFTRLFMKHMVKKHDGDTDTSRDYVYTDWVDLEKKLKMFLLGVAKIPLAKSSLAPLVAEYSN
jgi:menaquinone-dependent protoporphyrinogen oxidase